MSSPKSPLNLGEVITLLMEQEGNPNPETHSRRERFAIWLLSIIAPNLQVVRWPSIRDPKFVERAVALWKERINAWPENPRTRAEVLQVHLNEDTGEIV